MGHTGSIYPIISEVVDNSSTPCEGDQHSVPSSKESSQEMIAGYAGGELIKIEEGEMGRNRAVEIFLAECRQTRKGEELDLMRWDKIKEEEARGAGEEQHGKEKKNKSTQTKEKGL